MKLVLWLLLGLLVYLALRIHTQRNRAKFRDNLHKAAQAAEKAAAQTNGRAPPKSSAPAENMVACAYCQIYLPVSEAIHLVIPSSTDYYYCCDEHAKLHSSATQKPPTQPVE